MFVIVGWGVLIFVGEGQERGKWYSRVVTKSSEQKTNLSPLNDSRMQEPELLLLLSRANLFFFSVSDAGNAELRASFVCWSTWSCPCIICLEYSTQEYILPALRTRSSSCYWAFASIRRSNNLARIVSTVESQSRANIYRSVWWQALDHPELDGSRETTYSRSQCNLLFTWASGYLGEWSHGRR